MELGKLAIWANVNGPISFFEDEKSGELGPATAERLARFARRVEELGYDSIWMPDAFGRDPLLASAWLLANTTTLKVATGIISIYSRDPIAMRAGADALNEQWGGRFILGLGVSHRETVEGMRGHQYEKPIPAMRSYLEAIAKAPYYAAAPAEPTTIVLAGLREKMIELGGTHAQGAHSYLVTPEHTAQARAILGPDKLLCVEQPMALETDPVKARELARAEVAFYLTLPNYCNSWKALGFSDEDLANGGSDHFVDSLVAWGDEAALRKRIDEHLSAGATQVCIKPLAPGGGSTDMRIVELLAPGA
ncbi:TIGR03620 family F420-dependent LLM class oxidoreductase [Sphingobium sp. AN641]|uniref:TIGR03620 family F420-dependent LLM class oxidoreductase n=1 Tax=Sphingobium sp. AN641 TaxID=3133443 RepID=UPI0030BFF729